IYKNGFPYTVDESELPVRLPDVQSYKPTGSGDSPLAAVEDFVNTPEGKRETNTMPGWAGSSWYFLRYMDPHNKERFVGEDKEKFWKQVDFYLGGSEHATGHLLYSRFWQNFLFDRGFVSANEPFKKLINQGMIQGKSSYIYRLSYEYNSGFMGAGEEFFEKFPKIYVSKEIAERYESGKATDKDQLQIDNAISKAKQILIDTKKFGTMDFSGNIAKIHVEISLIENDTLDTEAFKQKSRLGNENSIFVIDPEIGKFYCTSEVEKMSKSKYNVVTPDELIEKQGCDAFRMYEMFLGPIEQSKPWNTEGIDGVSRFLRKLWNLYHSQNGEFYVSDEKAEKDELKILHTAIKKIREDIERFSLNTCVSAFMIAVNDLSSKKCNKREILEPFIILLSPLAPHVAEEIWSKLGHDESIAKVDFPVLNEEYLVESSFEYPLSINGKMRMKLELPLALSKEEVEKEVHNQDLSRWTEGKPLKKVIVVHGKIINVVV
ncbi:MAG: class I tRNA ligase family protein, partial [Bacteroidia bacterium]